MTKIERKLKELGYKRKESFFGNSFYYKPYKSHLIYIGPPTEICSDTECDWDGCIAPKYSIIRSGEELKDLQIAWNILKSDLKEIKKIEEKRKEYEKEFVISTTTTSM